MSDASRCASLVSAQAHPLLITPLTPLSRSITMAAPGNFVYVPDTIDNQQWNIVSESFAVACAGAVHTGATVR